MAAWKLLTVVVGLTEDKTLWIRLDNLTDRRLF